jgi:hypothetical protein
VLGVDPAMFADAAFWDRTFAAESLDDLLARLAPGSSGPAPAILVGTLSGGQVVSLAKPLAGERVELPVRVVAHAEVFPGMRGRNTLLVVDRSVLARTGATAERQLWARGEERVVNEAIRRAGSTRRTTSCTPPGCSTSPAS